MAIYKCWIPEYGHTKDDAMSVDAFDAPHAASLCVERYEQRAAEYPVASGETVEIAVDVGHSEPAMFAVWGECRPVYYSRKAEPASAAEGVGDE